MIGWLVTEVNSNNWMNSGMICLITMIFLRKIDVILIVEVSGKFIIIGLNCWEMGKMHIGDIGSTMCDHSMPIAKQHLLP